MDSVISVVRSAKLEKGECDKKDEPGQYDEFAAREMTFLAVQRLCKERGSYSIPSSNTILYLHQNKFRNIAGLEKFTACKVLHLENNCIFKVEGISQLTNLRVLHLQSNAISVVEGLDACTNLDTLNISCNPIRDLRGLPESLRTLNAARCGLSQAASLRSIAEMCPRLQVVDLQQNALGGEETFEALAGLAEARVLYLQGNHLASLPSYRRRLITSLTDLTYLDDRPVDEIERVGATAWSTGGVEAERAARQAYRDAKRTAERRSVTAFALERAARQAMRESLQLVGFQPGGGAAAAAEDGQQGPEGVQHRIVASEAAVDALPVHTLASIPAHASDCAVCSDAFCVGDATCALPCEHVFHTSCIRPWLLSFSNSCPLCRQTIGGDSRETFLGPGSQLAPLISETLMQRLVRPASAPARRSDRSPRPGAPAGVACSERGCAQSIAPPWTALGGAFTATDLVRHHAFQDNMAAAGRTCDAGGGDAREGAEEQQGGEERRDAPSDADPEQRRFREKINELCRRNVGSKSRQAESKLAAWNLMKHKKQAERDAAAEEARQNTPDQAAPTAGSALCVAIPSPCAAGDEDDEELGTPGGSSVSSEAMVSGGSSPVRLANAEKEKEARRRQSSSAAAEDGQHGSPKMASPTVTSSSASIASTPGSLDIVSPSDADLLREKLRVERMLRFYANLNEERKQEQERMVKAAAAAAEAMAAKALQEESEAESGEDGERRITGTGSDDDDESGSGKDALNTVILSAAGERTLQTAKSVISLPTGGVAPDGGDDLWDIAGDITVSSMPYM